MVCLQSQVGGCNWYSNGHCLRKKKKDTSITETVIDISDLMSPLAEELGQIPHQSADNVPVC